jgi:uncharacterized glyoxalase superfamily protein PhnB
MSESDAPSPHAPPVWPTRIPRIVAREPAAAFLYVYVEDTDEACRRAVAAGARVAEPPGETPYGDRRCMLEDPWENAWQMATHRRDASRPEPEGGS